MSNELPEWLSKSEVEEDLKLILLLVENEEEMIRLFASLLTKKEMFQISCRLRAALLLHDGYNTVQTRDLSSDKPNISRGVISRAKLEFVDKDDGTIRRLYERLKTKRLGDNK